MCDFWLKWGVRGGGRVRGGKGERSLGRMDGWMDGWMNEWMQFASCYRGRCRVLGKPSPGRVKEPTSMKEIGL